MKTLMLVAALVALLAASAAANTGFGGLPAPTICTTTCTGNICTTVCR